MSSPLKSRNSSPSPQSAYSSASQVHIDPSSPYTFEPTPPSNQQTKISKLSQPFFDSTSLASTTPEKSKENLLQEKRIIVIKNEYQKIGIFGNLALIILYVVAIAAKVFIRATYIAKIAAGFHLFLFFAHLYAYDRNIKMITKIDKKLQKHC